MSDKPSCQDCGVRPGQEHDDGCDTARCLVTGHQRLSCGRAHEAGDLDCGRDIWTGLWPGEAECIEYGWVTSDGFPDLNRLAIMGRWNRQAQRWEPRRAHENLPDTRAAIEFSD
jgi:hypothetical protein